MNAATDYEHDMAMMFAFHDALRRELGHIARVSAARTDDPRRVMAAAAGWQMFKDYLHVHHGCEDDVLWPAMEKTLADRPDDLALLAALEAEHAKRIGPDAPRAFPWMLDGLDDAKTEHILEAIPEPLRAAYHNQWLSAYRQLDRWAASPGSPEGPRGWS
jgi:Hemerythrin HHE cation binding domain